MDVDFVKAQSDNMPEIDSLVVAEFYKRNKFLNLTCFNFDKDEDTDGISIISDSESETPVQPEQSKSDIYVKNTQNQHVSEFISLKSDIENSNLLNDVKDDLLGNNFNTHKLYIHKRNKRLSTVLNIIVLGSVITAAGVAIGHMWGVRNDCSVGQTTQPVNIILSNLYKLQEENAYLRSKLKEMILMNNIDIIRRKSGTETVSKKHNMCKKVFEDSIYTKNTETPIKCVENEERTKIDEHLIETKNDVEFLNDIKRLQNSYEHNKYWRDYEISKSLHQEEQFLNNIEKEQKSIQHNNIQTPKLKGEFPEHMSSVTITNIKNIYEIDPAEQTVLQTDSNEIYIKAECETSDTNVIINKVNKGKFYRKNKNIVNDDEIIKRNKSVKQIHKSKIYGRKKRNKKQKRKNKYEKLEKKYYLKNSDDVFIRSTTPETEYSTKTFGDNMSNNDINRNCEKTNMEISNENKLKNMCNHELEENFIKLENNLRDEVKEDEVTWYDKRAHNRNEARKKLEYGTFRKTNFNSASWYFQRMRHREQCRAKGNSTYRKRYKNFKKK